MRRKKLPKDTYRDLAAQTKDELPCKEDLPHLHTFSAEFEDNMDHLLQNPKRLHSPPRRKILRILAVAGIIILLIAVTVMSVSAVRQAVFKFFAAVRDRFVVATYKPEDGMLPAPDTILEFREPAYIPPGYMRGIVERTDYFHNVSFLDTDGLELLFEQTILDSVQYALAHAETKDSTVFEHAGITGLYRIIDEQLELVWSDNEYAYRITGLIDAEQALRMIASIQ